MSNTSLKADPPQSDELSVSDQDILLAAKGGGIAFVGNMFVYIFRFGFGVVLARLLGAELLGLYSLGSTITDIVSMMALLGLGAGMTRYIPIAVRQKDKARLWGIIQTGIALPGLAGLILAAGLFLLAEPLSYQIFDQPDLVQVLRLFSLSVPLYALMTALLTITQGFKRLEYKVYSQDIALNLSKLVLSLVLIGLGLSVTGAIVAHIAASAVAVVMLFYFVHHLFPLNRSLCTAKRNLGKILRFTLPVYLSQLLRQFSGSIETVVLGSFGVMSGVGIYITVLRLSSIGRIFHSSMQSIAIPMIADLSSWGKLDQLGRVYQITAKWGMTFNLPIFLTIALFPKPLLMIFGTDFISGASGLVILAFAPLFNASTGPCGSIITMTGHSKLTFVNSIIYLVITIALDLIFIPRWGIVGAALAVTLTGMLINTLRVAEVYVLFRFWPYDRSFLKPVMAGLIAATVTYLFNRWLASGSMILQVIAGILLLWSIYTLVIVALKLSREDRLVLDKLRARFSKIIA